jgi:hypothetical protein
VALALLFTKLKQAIESATSETVRYGVREFLVFMGIGVWLGLIIQWCVGWLKSNYFLLCIQAPCVF